MAPGDPVGTITTVSGGASATVSIPAGDDWILSSFATVSTAFRLDLTDGTDTGLGGVTGASQGNEVARVVVGATNGLEPSLRNTGCSSQDYSISGREI